MAMRYTDTEKWDDDWYLSLSPTMKCVWGYVCDKCDGAGLLKLSLRKMSSEIGAPVSRAEIEAVFEDRILWLSEDRVWVVGFIQFQFRKMSLNNRAHANIAKKALAAVVGIEATGRALKTILFLNEFISSQPSPNDTRPTLERPSTEGQPTDNSYKLIVKSKNLRKGSVREKHSYTPEFEAAYREYPLRVGKADAFDAFQKEIKPEEYDGFMLAIQRYSSDLAARGETKYIKHMTTFINKNRWRDWTDPTTGTVNLPKQKTAGEIWLEQKLAEEAARNPHAV